MATEPPGPLSARRRAAVGPRSVAHAAFGASLRCVRVDPAYARLLGHSYEHVLGKPFRDVNPGLTPAEARRVALLLSATAARPRQVHLHLRRDEATGRTRLWQFSYARAKVAAVSVLSVGGLDVTAQALRLVDHYRPSGEDPLGLLASPGAFRAEVADAVRRSSGGGGVGMLMLDVGTCLQVAWPAGSPERDLALLAISRRLYASARAGEVVSRLEPTRFAVLCSSGDGAIRLADRVRASVTTLLDTGAGVPVPGPKMAALAAMPRERGADFLRRARGTVEGTIQAPEGRRPAPAVVDEDLAARLIAGLRREERTAEAADADLGAVEGGRLIDLAALEPRPRAAAAVETLDAAEVAE
ncbi:MAG: PAS domain-containing protein [Kineosporiaceae bacterium]